MKIAKKPDTYSAATTARVISRRMRKAGFVMADTSDRFKWTEGWYVHRLGCSSTVIVSYNHPRSWTYVRPTAEEALEKLRIYEKVREFLVEAGYVFVGTRLEIKCDHD